MKLLHRSLNGGFTLLELLASMALFLLVMIVLVQITETTTKSWRFVTEKAEQFREARNAFDSMTRRLSRATLNTYWDYDSYSAPQEFVRRSELRFVCGPMQNGARPLDAGTTPPRPTHGIFFQAPFGYVGKVDANDVISPQFQGLDTALNTWGYYVEVADDGANRPPFIPKSSVPLRLRYRLMEFMPPSGAMSIYQKTSGSPGQNPDDQSSQAPRNYAGFDWFRDGLKLATGNSAPPASHVLAENIVALIILPKLSGLEASSKLTADRRETALAPSYFYHSGEVGPAVSNPDGMLNTKHQLPPILTVTMVSIDERSARSVNLNSASDDRFGVLRPDFAIKSKNYRADMVDDAADPAASANSLEKRLIDLKLNYRIFTSDVYLRGAKWSNLQVK